MDIGKTELQKLLKYFDKVTFEEARELAKTSPSKRKLKSALYYLNESRQSGGKLFRVAGYKSKQEFYKKVQAKGFRDKLSRE